MLHRPEISFAVEVFWKGGHLPLDELVFAIQHEFMNPVQAGEDLKEALPKHDDILDCRGWGALGKEVAQIPAVGIFQYQRVRAKLPERSVELDYVRRWVESEPLQRTVLVLVGSFMLFAVVGFEDEGTLGGPALFVLRDSDVNHSHPYDVGRMNVGWRRKGCGESIL